MRHQGKIRPIAGLEKERHAGHEAKHGILIMGIGDADGDQEGARADGQAMEQELLAPDARAPIQAIGDDATEGAENDVEQAEHGGPVAGAGLAEGGEVGEVVGAEDAVDGELGPEGAEVAAGEHERLQGEDHGHGFLEGGLDDHFAAGRVQHVLFGDLGLVVRDRTGVFARRLEAEFLLRIVRGAHGAGRGGSWFAVGEGARHVDDVTRDAVVGEVLLGMEVALGPFARRGVGAEEEHGDGGGGDEDEGHDEGDAPGDVRRQALVQDQAVEDGGHEEVGDAAAGVAEAAGERVGRADDVLIEEARRPYLAGYEGAAEDADEEA